MRLSSVLAGWKRRGLTGSSNHVVTKVVTEKTRTGWLLVWLQRNRVSWELDST